MTATNVGGKPSDMLPIRDHNPSRRTPYVTYALIAANIIVFLLYLPAFADERSILAIFHEWALIPARIMYGEGSYTFATSLFLHGSILHLAGNMLFLYIFGDNLEDLFGHRRFLLFYLICGFLAGLTHVFSDPSSMIPTVGASGAIAGVMGGYILLFPKARVDVLIILVVIYRIISVPAWLVLGAWFALQLFSGTAVSSDEGGVAYWAHAGGFVFGLLITLPFWLKRGGTTFWSATLGHPPHPETKYRWAKTSVPRIRRR